MIKKESFSARANLVNKYASQCVKCALCLPHCPTYEITKDENESPRGRIALFQALAQEKLPLTAKAKTHLDQCLGCRACEPVCPAQVEYGQLLIQGRALLKQLPQPEKGVSSSLMTRLLSWLLTKPSVQAGFHWVLWGLQSSGLRRLARRLQILKLLGLQRHDELLPPLQRPYAFQTHYSAIRAKRGTVMLFKGCVGAWCDQETLAASVFVLRHLGYDVVIPPQQTCCGAIALHSGNIEQTQALASQNAAAFDSPDIDTVITVATGCGAVLQSYDYHLSSQPNSKKSAFTHFAAKVMDIIQFIQQCEWPTDLSLEPLPLKVLLHTPCTRRFVLKDLHSPEQLLARIPQLSWEVFNSTRCCGAAGTYFLEHPTFATQLAQKLLSELDNIQVSTIVTTNIGCALHLQHQLKKNHIRITVSHPVTLLARSLGFSGLYS